MSIFSLYQKLYLELQGRRGLRSAGGEAGNVCRQSFPLKINLSCTDQSLMYSLSRAVFSGKKYDQSNRSDHVDISSGDAYINFNRFSARLVESGLGNISIIFGFFVIRNLLEEHIAADTYEAKVDLYGAVQWILFAGRKLFLTRNAQIDEAWRRGLEKETKLWRGDSGLSWERWSFWKQRILSLRQQEMQDEGVQEVLVEAWTKMCDIDRGHVGSETAPR